MENNSKNSPNVFLNEGQGKDRNKIQHFKYLTNKQLVEFKNEIAFGSYFYYTWNLQTGSNQPFAGKTNKNQFTLRELKMVKDFCLNNVSHE